MRHGFVRQTLRQLPPRFCRIGTLLDPLMEESATSAADVPPDLRDPEVWQRLVEQLQPAAMLLRVESRMSSWLKRRLSAEDVWQETLLCAWRDRAHFAWRGLPAFRSWLMDIAEHRIRDATDRFAAAKRDSGHEQHVGRIADDSDRGGADHSLDVPSRAKSPPSAAVHCEQAQLMREALQALPDIYREVLRLRLFEEWERERIAQHLGLSIPAVKHRIRIGATLYRGKLALLMSSRRSLAAEPRRTEPSSER